MNNKHGKYLLALVALLFLLARSRAKNIVSMSINEPTDVNTKENKQVVDTVELGKTFAFAKHFQNNMVLQKAPARANIYGFSSELGQKVICQMTTPSQQFYYATKVQQGPESGVGVWAFTLDPVDAGITVTITVLSEVGTLHLSNVIFGDVWLCSGQSNMQFTVLQMLNATEELEDAKNYPNIRIMTVADFQSPTPLYDLYEIEEAWTSPSNVTIGGKPWTYFSAVCWLYGKAIHKALGYPIGLVATDWGGTPVEAWSSQDALAKCNVTDDTAIEDKAGLLPSTEEKLLFAESDKLMGPEQNTVLWNAMVYPLLGMTIYGTIWYQGEDDATTSVRMNRYNCTFPTMIKDWRAKFSLASGGQTNATFPFGFVQLAPNKPDPANSVGFPDIRFHQTADWGYTPNQDLPNVFMAVTMDLPDFNSMYGAIHPQDKEDVGVRLSLAGLAVAYGQQEMFQGPFPKTAQLTSKGLLLVYGDPWNLEIRDIEGFEFLCAAKPVKKWVPTSIIAGNQTTITLLSSVCGQGQALFGLRYAWRESPCAFKKCAVYETMNGLPAPPFIVMQPDSFNKKSYFKFDGPTRFQHFTI